MRVFTASLAEMWSSARRRARLSPDEAADERLLAGQGLDRQAPASQRTLELVLTAAAGPATHRELAGESAAVTAFLAALPERERPPRRVPVLAVAFTLAALLALCGTAEAGALPAPLQQLAHQAINAPAPSPAMRVPQPSADVTPGSGDTGSQSTPIGSGASQDSSSGKPSVGPKPTHTSNGNGQPTASNSAQPTKTDNGKGNGGTPGQGNGKGKGKGKGDSQG
jgi:hypothetical protein